MSGWSSTSSTRIARPRWSRGWGGEVPVGGELRPHAETSPGTWFSPEPPAERGDPFAHAGEPGTGSRCGPGVRLPVVVDLYAQAVRAVVESDRHRRRPPACRPTLVRDSWTMRYTARRRRRAAAEGPADPDGGGHPCTRARSTSSSSRSTPLPAVSSPATSTTRPQHLEGRPQFADRLAARLLDGDESLGHLLAPLSGEMNATPDCTLITDMLWVSESCSSRAIRSRSSPARRRAVSSRVRSASTARSAARTAASRCRDTSAVTPAANDPPERQPPLHDITHRLTGCGAGRQHADHHGGPGDRDREAAATGPHRGVRPRPAPGPAATSG